MKLLFIGPLAPPVGGMATVVQNLREGLSSHTNVRLLNNAKTTRQDRYWYEGVMAQLHLLGKLTVVCLQWRPEVVHIHTSSWLTFWRNAIDVLLVRLLGKRVILHIHGGHFHSFLSGLSPAHARLARCVFHLCDRVIVLGLIWKQLLDRWCEPTRVVVIPNSVPIPPLQEIQQERLFTIVCFANYGRNKGHGDLLRAVAQLRTESLLHVALLGAESEPGWHQALLDQALALGLAHRVSVPGLVTGTDKQEWWARASCFCLPSHNEGMPMAMLEAMALGLPVVVTSVGAVPETLIDGSEGLLYAPGDIDALANHLQALLDDPKKAQAIGYAGRARVTRDFNIDCSVQQLLDLYAEVVPDCRLRVRADLL